MYFRYVPKITVTRDHLRELQQLYTLRAKDKNKACISDWIHRLAAHLRVDVQPYLEPYEDSSDEEAMDTAVNTYPDLDDRIYVNMTEPLLPGMENEEEAEEEYVHEEDFAEET